MMTAVRQEWQRCKHWIEAALARARGAYAIEDIEAGIASGQYQFWPGNKSAAVTEVHQYPRARFFHLFLAGGDLEEIRDHFIPMWREYAPSLGCSRLTIFGRRGWERALKTQGWDADIVCLSLALSGNKESEKPTRNPKHYSAEQHPRMADGPIEDGGSAGG